MYSLQSALSQQQLTTCQVLSSMAPFSVPSLGSPLVFVPKIAIKLTPFQVCYFEASFSGAPHLPGRRLLWSRGKLHRSDCCHCFRWPHGPLLLLPKNTTIAEVIEFGLEWFGISEGVVDGGDEAEDTLANRRSQPRVRYGLSAQFEGQGGL